MTFLERFDTEFAPKLFKRAKTFRLMFERLEAMKRTAIVETGCVRELECWEGDGCSSIVFDDYVAERNRNDHFMSSFISVDKNPHSLELLRTHRKSDRTATNCNDSVQFLKNHSGIIDLLYLDSFDLDPENPRPSSLHHLKELAAAQKNLRPGSIIAVDDNHPNGVGKGSYVRDYLSNIGIEPIADDYQIVWIWK